MRPDENFHVREISRLTAVPGGSLHRELKLLVEAGLLTLHAVGNQVRYQANRDCPISTNWPGHHMTVIQSLPQTIRSAKRDLLRRKRNLTDYSGGWVYETSMERCIFEARDLLRDVAAWFMQQKPELV